MMADITDTGGVRLIPQCDVDRFILRRLADGGRLYLESAGYSTGPNERNVLFEVTINIVEPKAVAGC